MWLTYLNNGRTELEQRQREQKKEIGLDWQNKNLARAPRFLVHFFCRRFTTTTWKCLISRFAEDVNNFFCFSSSLTRSFRIQVQKNFPTRIGISAIKIEVARIHFKWSFRSRRRPSCLRFLKSNFVTTLFNSSLILGYLWFGGSRQVCKTELQCALQSINNDFVEGGRAFFAQIYRHRNQVKDFTGRMHSFIFFIWKVQVKTICKGIGEIKYGESCPRFSSHL